MEVEIFRFCHDLYREPMNGRLLLLFGENGTAKTHCARAVHKWVFHVARSKEFMERKNHISHIESLYWRWPELLDKLKGGGWDLIDDTLNVPCLILDELGGGHDPSRVGVDKLCQILSRRENRFTLITTNVLAEAWDKVFDRRVTSRLFRNSVHVDLTDVPDFAKVEIHGTKKLAEAQ